MSVWPVNAKTPDFLYVDMLFDAIVAIGTTAYRRAQVHARGARPRDADDLLVQEQRYAA